MRNALKMNTYSWTEQNYFSLLGLCCLLSNLILIILLVCHLPLIKNFSSGPLTYVDSWKKTMIFQFRALLYVSSVWTPFYCPSSSLASLHKLWCILRLDITTRKPSPGKAGCGYSVMCSHGNLVSHQTILQLPVYWWGPWPENNPFKMQAQNPWISYIWESTTYLLSIRLKCLKWMNDYIGIKFLVQSEVLALFSTQIGIVNFQQDGDVIGRELATHWEEW